MNIKWLLSLRMEGLVYVRVVGIDYQFVISVWRNGTFISMLLQNRKTRQIRAFLLYFNLKL
ncbi:hypothetical protein C3K47_17955 [Solitalea longa]|uniref:Uncharacterized protein n=1 Tax=Solitalea longa TaxID=2079460 RepID=A0A2S4ZWU8_9SPHI|nr:hypothetical protein C3K47_17955 [Solitalea longa]